MIRRILVLLLVCFACAKETPPPPAAPPPVPELEVQDVDSDNLLNMGHGASVVSRTGELNLESSAAHAIDGIASSFWVSPMGSVEKTLVFSLLAPSRVRSVGITSPSADETPRRIRFEGSMDAKHWRELGAMDVKRVQGRQLIDVPETVAQYIRIHVEPETQLTRAHAFHVLGDEAAPPSTPTFGGCWTINGEVASFAQDGARITGNIGSITLDGGTPDNRVALFTWTEGPMHGYAAFTRTPDGAHLTGLRFYDQFGTRNLGEAWFGERCAVWTAATPVAALPAVRSQSGDWRRRSPEAFGLVFDKNGHLIEALSEPALRALPPKIKTITIYADDAAARAASLRDALKRRGIDTNVMAMPVKPQASALQRLLATRVDIIPAP